MRYIILLTVLFTAPRAASERVILQPNGCDIVIIRGDEPGIAIHTVGRSCTMPSKADWAKANDLDTTVTDTTKVKK